MTPILLLLAALQCGDVTTSAIALQRGGIEKNPLFPQAIAWNVATQGAVYSGELYAIHRLHHTHPKVAIMLTVAGIAVEGYAVAHNTRTITRR